MRRKEKKMFPETGVRLLHSEANTSGHRGQIFLIRKMLPVGWATSARAHGPQ